MSEATELWQRALAARQVDQHERDIRGRLSEEQRLSRKARAQNRCRQCWKKKPGAEFIGARGRPIFRCRECRAKYSNWTAKTLTEKLAVRDPRVDAPPTGRVLWIPSSQSHKLGGIPASMSERGTCPPRCGLYGAGCYSDYHKVGMHWRHVGARGLPWAQFLEQVRALPAGQLWRHNVAGDLPGAGEDVDEAALHELVAANRSAGARGFTFTHKAPRFVFRMANNRGFTINLSADTLPAADELARADVGPVAVILPHDAPKHLKTPAGRHVVVCLAQTDDLTCADCQLCAQPQRRSVVGFRAHGQYKAHVPELVQLRRKELAG